MTREVLSLRIELADPRRPAGTAVVANEGEEPVRLWNPGNSWGDDALTFEVTRDGGSARLVRNAVYTRNVPSAADVPPGGRHELPFDLTDGTWEGDPPGPGARLVAVYDVPETLEAEEQGVWRGSLRSEPVELG